MNNIPDYDKDRKAFALFAGEVLQPETNKHNTNNNIYGYCEKCETYSKNYTSKICFPDPIDCEDWNTAMKWRDWAVEKFKKVQVFRAICRAMDLYEDVPVMVVTCAQPHHIIEAVVRLVLKEKE